MEKVKNQSGCFANLIGTDQGVALSISSPLEVSLLTNEMIK